MSMSRKSCLSFALLSVSGRKPLLRSTRNLRTIFLSSICHSSSMDFVLRGINNLCQVGLTGAQTCQGRELNNPGSFAPPSTWEELKLALLDVLMPANSIEECAIKLATFIRKRARLYPPLHSASERSCPDLSRLSNATPKVVRPGLR